MTTRMVFAPRTAPQFMIRKSEAIRQCTGVVDGFVVVPDAKGGQLCLAWKIDCQQMGACTRIDNIENVRSRDELAVLGEWDQPHVLVGGGHGRAVEQLVECAIIPCSKQSVIRLIKKMSNISTTFDVG